MSYKEWWASLENAGYISRSPYFHLNVHKTDFITMSTSKSIMGDWVVVSKRLGQFTYYLQLRPLLGISSNCPSLPRCACTIGKGKWRKQSDGNSHLICLCFIKPPWLWCFVVVINKEDGNSCFETFKNYIPWQTT